MVIAQASGNTLLGDMGIAPSQARSAATISVRNDLLLSPSLATTGQVQYDQGKNEYRITAGDNTGIQSLAELMSTKNLFDQAGGMTIGSKTFTEYATSILSNTANQAAVNASQYKTPASLSESLSLEHKNISGVSLDEEMSNLILYQQAFSASARVLAIIQQMFKTLEDAV
jgi:flagellar hook-associated protein 1 FlgK